MWKSSSVSNDTTSILSDLTPPQLEAATATGPVLVLAGAVEQRGKLTLLAG